MQARQQNIKIETIMQWVDNQDAEAFASAFNTDGKFVFANNPPVIGPANIASYLQSFFSMIDKVQHSVIVQLETESKMIYTGEVNYMRLDQSTLRVPYCDLIELENGKISTFQVYVDNSKLFI